jgi:hypothetical protein
LRGCWALWALQTHGEEQGVECLTLETMGPPCVSVHGLVSRPCVVDVNPFVLCSSCPEEIEVSIVP